MRMRVLRENLRVEIENEMRVFLESLNFEIEMRVKSAIGVKRSILDIIRYVFMQFLLH